MSRVFVSSAYRDRAVGERVGGILEDLGDEPVDDRDDTKGTAWWNEVVGRIETCELFVAVVSPAYADAHACRLAAKHAAATGLPVVRLDLGDRPPKSGLHPVVMTAPPVRFDPDDPGAPQLLERVLDQALDEGPSPDQPVASPRQEARPAPALEPAIAAAEVSPNGAPPSLPPPPDLPPAPPAAPPVAPPGDSAPGPEDAEPGRLTGLELTLAVVMVLVTLALLVIEGRALMHIVTGGPEAAGGGQVHGVTTTSDQQSTAPPSAAPSPTVESAVESPDGSPEAQQLLAAIAAVASDRLPASSCTAGDGQVTCRDPASNIGAVVLAQYSSQAELYDAYTAAVGALSGDPVPENVGDCSGEVYEGEITWNTDLGHRRDITVADQAAGGLDPASESAGRLFCTESSDVVKLVWTQDPGLLVTATGQPARLAIGWWHDLHMQLACGAGATGSGCE